MAVRIDIPGVGTVRAENAAQEDTLQALLRATQKNAATNTNTAASLNKNLGQAASAAQAGAAAMNATAGAARANAANMQKLQTGIANSAATVEESALSITRSRLTDYLAEVGKVALSTTNRWAQASNTIARDPFDPAAEAFAKSTDLAASGLIAINDASTSVIAKMIPGLDKIKGMQQKTVESITNTANTIGKQLNQLLSTALKDVVRNMETFNSMGASFQASYEGMIAIAAKSGLTLDIFTRGIAGAESSVRAMGLSMGDATIKIAQVAGVMAQQDDTGKSLRKELLALGYSYEKQIELSASYMAMLRSQMTAEQLRVKPAAELARETRRYAVDLKVLADITGKNAQAAMEEARLKSMEADIMAQLKPEEAAKFQQAYAAMPDYAKKGFLEYVSTGGQAIVDQATNIGMAQNEAFERLIKQSYANIKDPTVAADKLSDATLKLATDASEMQRQINAQGGGTIAMVTRLTGNLSGITDILNGLSKVVPSKAEIDASRASAEAQAAAANKLKDGIVGAKEAALAFGLEVQNLAHTALPSYSRVIESQIIAVRSAFEGLGTLIGDIAAGRVNFENITRDFGQIIKKQDEVFLNMGQVLKDIVERLKTISTPASNAKGGLIPNPILSYLAEDGPEAVVPLPDGKSIPVSLNMPDIMRSGDPQISAQQFAQAFIEYTKNKESSTAMPGSSADLINVLPDVVTSAIENIVRGPDGFVTVMTDIKNQLSEDNKQQLYAMQEQIEKLKDIVSATQDNVRVNENIVNVLS